MNNLATGVDLIEVSRIAMAVERHGERFLKRIYTHRELSLIGGKIESLAGRFAAKEAVAKALGSGIGEVSWLEIEVLRDEHKRPEVHLHGNAARLAEEKGLKVWSLSLSHTAEFAVAFVTGWG